VCKETGIISSIELIHFPTKKKEESETKKQANKQKLSHTLHAKECIDLSEKVILSIAESGYVIDIDGYSVTDEQLNLIIWHTHTRQNNDDGFPMASKRCRIVYMCQ